MNREEAFNLLKEKLKNQNLLKHSSAVEAVMRSLAEYFNEDQKKWGLTGLLHDIDYEETKEDPQKHSLVGAEILEKFGLETEIVEAVKAHNEIHHLPRETKLAQALSCADPATGLIVAAALVLPSKKINDLTTENVLNRYQEKGFAKGANRQHIASCQELGLSLEKFFEISLAAMKNIALDLGL